MRYRASEKREIIDLVERSSLPVRRTLERLGIPKSTFYGWYERYREGGYTALADVRPSNTRVWNRSWRSLLSERNSLHGSFLCGIPSEDTSCPSPVFTGF